MSIPVLVKGTTSGCENGGTHEKFLPKIIDDLTYLELKGFMVNLAKH